MHRIQDRKSGFSAAAGQDVKGCTSESPASSIPLSTISEPNPSRSQPSLQAKVSQQFQRELFERAEDFSILLDDAVIMELSFSSTYTAAIEAKQVAQQEAQRARAYVDKAKEEKKQKIVQAEGEAEAARMLGEAVAKNPGYLKLRRIRAAQNVAKMVAQSQNKVYLSADTLMLNLQDRESCSHLLK